MKYLKFGVSVRADLRLLLGLLDLLQQGVQGLDLFFKSLAFYTELSHDGTLESLILLQNFVDGAGFIYGPGPQPQPPDPS